MSIPYSSSMIVSFLTSSLELDTTLRVRLRVKPSGSGHLFLRSLILLFEESWFASDIIGRPFYMAHSPKFDVLDKCDI